MLLEEFTTNQQPDTAAFLGAEQFELRTNFQKYHRKKIRAFFLDIFKHNSGRYLPTMISLSAITVLKRHNKTTALYIAGD